MAELKKTALKQQKIPNIWANQSSPSSNSSLRGKRSGTRHIPRADCKRAVKSALAGMKNPSTIMTWQRPWCVLEFSPDQPAPDEAMGHATSRKQLHTKRRHQTAAQFPDRPSKRQTTKRSKTKREVIQARDSGKTTAVMSFTNVKDALPSTPSATI